MLRETGRDSIAAMTLLPRLGLALILCTVLPALPRAAEGVSVAKTTLRTVEGDRAGPFAPGETVAATLLLRNGTDRAVALRDLDLRLGMGLDAADPAGDGLDNDGDGAVDEADEAFDRREDGAAAWRFGEGGLRLGPGESVARVLRLDIDAAALPGSTLDLSVTAASVPAGARPTRPWKDEAAIPVAISPARLILASNEDTGFVIGDAALLDGRATLPGGTLPDGRLTLTLPPAMTDARIGSYRIGAAVTCAREPVPRVRDDEASLAFGGCTVDPRAPARDRTVQLSVSAALVGAPEGAGHLAVADWRTLSVYLGLWSGDDLLDGKVRDIPLYGPRPVVQMTLPRADGYRPGDPVTVRVSVTNRGDRPLAAPRLLSTAGETFLCEGALVAGREVPCGDEGMTLPDIAVDATLEATVRLRLRGDALIDPETGPRLALAAKGLPPRALPGLRLAMALHDGPALTVADAGPWEKRDGVFAATIGERGTLRVTGTLPPGRYRGAIRLLARSVDARTGAPVGPAALTLGAPDLSITTPDGDETGTLDRFDSRTGTLWSQHVVGFDLTGATDAADRNRRFRADFDVSLADDPAIVAGHLVEVAAETVAYGRNAAPGGPWVEILVREPDLRLKIFSFDADRIVQPGETFGVLSLACNYGDSPAHDPALTLDTPEAVDLASADTAIRAFVVPLEIARDGVPDVIDAAGETLEDAAFEIGARTVSLGPDTAPVAPETCLAIALRAPLRQDHPGEAAPLTDALTVTEGYASHPDAARARLYPGARTAPLRFRMPVIAFGPSTTLQLGTVRRIAHPVTLTVPRGSGGFRVALAPQSSTGLDWTLFEERDGAVEPWLDNARTYAPGETLRLVMRATAPDILPLGWVDTSRLDAEVLTDGGQRLGTALRLVLRADTERAIETDKRIALDRDCDGDLSDERGQDGVFEPVKDATPGDCIVVRIGFENAGTREVERILIRDVVSRRTTLLSGSPAVRIAPEPLDRVSEPAPDGEDGALEWQFRGLFRPGAVGEVEYRLRLDPL